MQIRKNTTYVTMTEGSNKDIPFGSSVLQLWTCFQHRKRHELSHSPPLLSTCPNSWTKWRSMFSVSGLFTVPRVHATEVPAKTDINNMVITKPRVIISDREVQEYLANETGQDRVRKMFEKNADTTFSSDLQPVVSSVNAAVLMMFLVGGTLGAVQARQRFIENHKHHKFTTHLMATRRHTDAVFLGLFRGGVYWALRTGGFVLLFMLPAQTVSVYRNKTTPWEYVGSGMLTCAVLRANLGLRAMAVATGIGAVLGLVGGLASYGLMHAGGFTQEQKHYWEVYDFLKNTREAEVMQQDALLAKSTQTVQPGS